MSSALNTRYRVDLAARAERDLTEIFAAINAVESLAASRWFNALETLVFSLDHLPERGKSTPEDRTLRQLLHGNKPHIYRVIYSIDEALKIVRILHIRHGARGPFQDVDVQTGA